MAEKNLSDVEGKKPALSIKKNTIIGIILLIVAIIVCAFLKASLSNDTSQNSTSEIEKEEEKPIDTVVDPLDDVIKSSYADKKAYTQKKISYADNNIKSTSNDVDDFDSEIFGRNMKLEEYYVTLVDEELQARNSDIDYGIGDKYYTSSDKSTEEDSVNKKINSRNVLNPYSITKSESEFEVKAGGVIPGILLTGINSELHGDIIGVVRESIYDTVTGKYLLIPQGTKILGQYNSDVNFGQSRLFIVWERLIFPNGNSIMLNNFPGVDMTGYAGMTGKINNHTFKLFQSVVLSSILGGVASQIETKQDRDNNLEEDIAYAAGEKIIDIGNNLADKIINIQPTIEISPGSRFNILINADLVLEPYID